MLIRPLVAVLLGTSAVLAAAQLRAQSTVTTGAAAASDAVSADSAGLVDIVVTAQKRATSVQNTPLAVTAVTGADLRTRQIDSIESLALSLPNVNFGKNVGFARIAIRGVGLDTTVACQEGRVAYHVDGVYISRPSAAIATFFDVNRIEVVRGPQGTLYGRNATAGAINVVTNDPQNELGGYAKLTVGNYGLISSEGAITDGISDTLSARFAFQTVDRDGYGRGLVTGQQIDNEHTYAFRGKLRFKPSESFDIVVSADYSHENDQAFVYHYLGPGKPNFVPFGPRLGGRVAPNPRDSYGDVPQVNYRNFYGFGAVANLDLGFGTLTSVTGYRDSYTNYDSDADGTDVNITNFRIVEQATQFSQELRLAGSTHGIKWLVGGYYFDERIYGNVAFSPLRQLSGRPPFAQGVDYRGNLKTSAYAGFGQLDYEIVRGVTLSAGGRYSYERKSIDHYGVVDAVTPYNPTVPFNYTLFQTADVDFDAFTPRLGIEYKITRDILAYFTYAKGFKSGGFSLNAFNPPLQPEKLTDYEGGVKAEWFGGKLRTNVAAFYYDYTNLQVQKILGAVALPVNAAAATVKGVEIELATRPAEGLELSGNVSLLDAKFDNFATSDAARPELGVIDLSGKHLPQAPNYTVNLAAAYTLDTQYGAFTLRGEAARTGRVFFSPYNRPEVAQDAYTKFNAFLNYRRDNSGWTGSLFVRNIADRRTVSSSQVSAGFSGFPILGAFDPPRTFGASVGYSF